MPNEQTFDENGNLPPGEHEFGWDELVQAFGWNEWRMTLLGSMAAATRHLKSVGCRRIYVDGSFVTSKSYPGDYDACWERSDTDLKALDPVLLDFTLGRERQKAKYLGEWFPVDVRADRAGATFIEFFQLDRSGNAKGIVVINLGSLA